MRWKIFVKAVIYTLLIILWTTAGNYLEPLVANQLAIQQMQNQVDSSIWIQLYTYAVNYRFLIFIVIALLLFYKEIQHVCYILREKKHEKN